jgi:UDP:flavonoid glycosyltransferase YjiC (YdhE family)
MRILALPYGEAVAHVTRLLEVARVLRDRDGVETVFAGAGKALDLVRSDGFEVRFLPEPSLAKVAQALRRNALREIHGTAEQIAAFVDAEGDLIRVLAPDLVLCDNRPSARISCALAGVPHAVIINAHATRFARTPLAPVGFRYGGMGGMTVFCRAVNGLLRRMDRIAMGLVTSRLNQVTRSRGLRNLDPYAWHEGRNLTCLADLPEFTPVRGLPPDVRFVGPITWRAGLPAPSCLEAFRRCTTRVYLTLGSGGLPACGALLKDLGRDGIAVLMAAGELLPQCQDLSATGVLFVEKYLDGDRMLPHCHLMVCHGGNGSIYQALRHGVPIVAMPWHMEQEYNARRVEQIGVGLRIGARKVLADPQSLSRIIRRILSEPAFRERAAAWRRHVGDWDGPATAARALLAAAGKATDRLHDDVRLGALARPGAAGAGTPRAIAPPAAASGEGGS